SRLLTGILTGTERWNGCGDTPFEDGRSGKPPSGTLEAEAERLGADGLANRIGVARIKTSNAQLEMISQTGATPLTDLRIGEPRCRERNRRWRKSHQTKT
ncbi:MAG: hypothetical protein ACKVQW_05770, partial [Pyrinomonadaceae bacterium]